jgi:hypothetical protein
VLLLGNKNDYNQKDMREKIPLKYELGKAITTLVKLNSLTYFHFILGGNNFAWDKVSRL